MQRKRWRQVVTFGLVLLFGWSILGWLHDYQANRKVAGELQDAGVHLKDRVIVIDPGHGGRDPGAVISGVVEKELTLQISMVLKGLLEEQGAKVVLTRSEDVALDRLVREDINKRVAIARENKANAMVSIHANRDSCRCWGAQSFYQRGSDPANRQLATAVQTQLRRLTPTTRKPLPGNFRILSEPTIPGTIVEVGFMTWDEELKRLQEPKYQRTLATAIALGLSEFFRTQVSGVDLPDLDG